MKAQSCPLWGWGEGALLPLAMGLAGPIPEPEPTPQRAAPSECMGGPLSRK